VTNIRIRAGERSNWEGKAVSNRILLRIPDEEFRGIREHLEYIELPHHYSLNRSMRPLRFAYFLNRGLASIVVTTLNKDVEAGVVGHEGFVGAPLLAGLKNSPLGEQMQIAGNGFRIAAKMMSGILEKSPLLRLHLTRYAILLGLQVAQTAACNRLHGVQQRLARWLLLAQDRVDSGAVPITHDFLATMLGTDRPSVSLAAAQLQRRKTIGYQRGKLRVLNRKKLENLVCECYGVIRQFDGELELR
jgi:CRP-like cAMP-binding protein